MAASNTQNSDLIKTYYSGNDTHQKKEIVLFPKKYNLHNHKLLFIISITILSAALIAAVAYLVYSHDVYSITPHSSEYKKVMRISSQITLKRKMRSVFIDLGSKRDLGESSISFKARSENGNDRIAIILRDSKNISNADKDDAIFTPIMPKGRWRFFDIRLKDFDLPVDMTRVTQLRFDNSGNLTGNNAGSIIYIKDIAIKER